MTTTLYLYFDFRLISITNKTNYEDILYLNFNTLKFTNMAGHEVFGIIYTWQLCDNGNRYCENYMQN